MTQGTPLKTLLQPWINFSIQFPFDIPNNDHCHDLLWWQLWQDIQTLCHHYNLLRLEVVNTNLHIQTCFEMFFSFFLFSIISICHWFCFSLSLSVRIHAYTGNWDKLNMYNMTAMPDYLSDRVTDWLTIKFVFIIKSSKKKEKKKVKFTWKKVLV